MKRINLITPKTYFPVELPVQKNAVLLLLLVLITYSGLKGYLGYEELKSGNAETQRINTDIGRIKQALSENKTIEEKSSYIENEFSSIAADYQLLKKDVVIRDIFSLLSRIVPANTWITSMEFKYEGEKSLSVKGSSLYKEEVFTFLKSSSAIGKNPELITVQAGGNNVFNFEIRIELL